jgi:hypothetical protein
VPRSGAKQAGIRSYLTAFDPNEMQPSTRPQRIGDRQRFSQRASPCAPSVEVKFNKRA